jgi:AraC-like DNA-binding protein
MEYRELPAPPPLDSLVHCFWFLRGHFDSAETQPIVADGRLEIILHLAEPFARVDESGRLRRQPEALVSGQLTAPLHIAPSGHADVVGIRFRTDAAGTVLRTPLWELTDRVDACSHLAPRLADALLTAAARSVDPAARRNALSSALLRFAWRCPDPMVRAATRALDTTDVPRVGAVADALGVSARTLERRVTDHTGLPPAALRRVLRFRRSFRLLSALPPGAWARAAAQAGYYDQAHLIRDFRQFAGVAPGEFFGADPDLARAISASPIGDASVQDGV